jgi:mitochondrial fission protein ELM1
VLALADRLVVTADSVSMVSEALATPHPVEVYMLDLGGRHTRFVTGLIDKGLVRPFDGEVATPPARPVLDASAEAAAAVRGLFGRA